MILPVTLSELHSYPRGIVSLQPIFPSSHSRISSARRITPLIFVHGFLSLATLFSACFLSSGCATSNADIKTYLDPGFTKTAFRRIAVFPIRDRRITAKEARQLNKEFSEAIGKKNPSIVIVGPEEAKKVLNDNGLADQAIRFEDHYYSDVLPSPGTLKTIGQTLGVDAILQGEIVDFQQTDGVFDRNKGKTRVTVHYSMTGMASGKLQWEASSDGSVTTLTTAELAPPIIYAIQSAQEKILTVLPF